MTPARTVAAAVLLAAVIYGVGLWSSPYLYEDQHWVDFSTSGHVAVWTLPGRLLTMASYQPTVNPRAQHLISLGVHLANGVTLYALGAALTTAPIAAVAAVVFLLHPLNSEAVSYLSARSDLLETWAVLLAALLAVRAAASGRWWGLLAAMACAVAAAWCKEVGVVAIPLLLWTVAIWRLDRPMAHPLTTGGLVLLGLLLGLSYRMATAAGMAFVGLQVATLGRFVGLALWPAGLSFDHDALALGPLVPLALIGLAGVLVLAAVLRHRAPLLGWAVGWVLIVLGPRLVVASPEYLNEHWFYPAMPALCLLGAAGLVRLTEGVSWLKPLRLIR